MFSNKLIIEIIDNNITIYKNSLIVKEPLVALITKVPFSVVMIGKEAEDYIIKKEDNYSKIYPMKNGEIADITVFRCIIDLYLARIVKASLFLSELIIIVPTTYSTYERDRLYTTVKKCGVRNILLIEKARLFRDFFNGEVVVYVEMGEGSTEITILKENDIFESIALNFGGDEICNLISERIKEVYNLKITDSLSKNILKKLGSLYPTDNTTMTIFGRDIYDNRIRENVEITSGDIFKVVNDAFDKINQALITVLENMPLEDLTFIQLNGILFNGEFKYIRGMTDYFARNLSLKLHLWEDTNFDIMGTIKQIKKELFIKK